MKKFIAIFKAITEKWRKRQNFTVTYQAMSKTCDIASAATLVALVVVTRTRRRLKTIVEI